MYDDMIIQSRFRNYGVRFVDDFSQILRADIHQNAFLIVDSHIMDLYRDAIESACPADRQITIEATEFNKTLDACQSVILKLLDKGIRKNTVLIALGGGIIQDITAFIASILFRGIDWHFYPTTLLAQADSCIGGKSSINIGSFKNQVGTFYPPAQIISDANFLKTLPVSEIKSGIGEILHFMFIAGSEQAQHLSDEYDQVFKKHELLKKHIQTSLTIKKGVVEIDEFDNNERNLFNYGHTFGHAIEAASAFDIPHGQAVTLGMDMANYISICLNYLKKEHFDFMHRILVKNIPVFRLSENNVDDYLNALSKDKKNIGSNVVCILTRGPGEMFKAQLPLDDELRENTLSYFHRFA